MTSEIHTAPAAKRAVLTEALKLFASRGVEAVSVRDIAAATGYSNPALFRHFASKDELARTLFTASYRQLVEALVAARATRDLRSWLAAALSEIAASPEAVHFVMQNLRCYWDDLPDDLKARNLPSLVREALGREARAGRLRADLDQTLAITVVLGALGQIARSVHFHQSTLDPEEAARGLAELLLRGLAPR